MGQGRLQPDVERKRFTLNSTQPVSGAGSGIVAGPDRVRRGEEGETGGAWTQAAPEVKGCYRRGGWDVVAAGGGGRYWHIFMGCRCPICRCLIELCNDELVPPPDLHQDNPRQRLRGQPSFPGQNEQPAADG